MNKGKKFVLFTITFLLLSCENNNTIITNKPTEAPVSSPKITATPIPTPNTIVGTQTPTPISTTTINTNTMRNKFKIFIINADGSDKKELTNFSASESNPQWISNSKIAFKSDNNIYISEIP